MQLTEIAREVYFSSLGERTDWNRVKAEYKLSEDELNYVISIIRTLNSR